MLKRMAIGFFTWTSNLIAQSDETMRLRVTIGMLASLMGVFFSLALGIPLLLLGEPLAGMVSLYLGVWMLSGIGFFAWKRVGFDSWVHYNLFGESVAIFINSILLGGFEGSGALILWLLLCPLLASILSDMRATFYWSGVFVVLLLASLVLPEIFGYVSELPPGTSKWIFLFNAFGISTFVLVVVQYFAAQRNLYQERSDRLLLNILPREIADILRNENRIIADAFEGASILFADVVDFTPMSANMSPVELVELLNEVFSHFDALVEKYGLEKIKTIGDCYMVASGIPRPRMDHAQAVTLMGLEILRFVETRSFRGRKLSFRIGINSGPVVAGVIGQKKFTYDLWGDAVNTASRMESQGTRNNIQITRNTFELIQNDFVCLPQPPAFIKGKGEMEIWHVIGPRL